MTVGSWQLLFWSVAMRERRKKQVLFGFHILWTSEYCICSFLIFLEFRRDFEEENSSRLDVRSFSPIVLGG
jgi:hypothetical protein